MKQIRSLFHRLTSRFWFVMLIIGGIAGVLSILFLFPDTSASQLVVVKIATISALFAAIGSLATAIQALEAQKQREALERPSVVVFFDVSSSGKIYFVVKNIGNSPAIDVTVEFLPPVDTVVKDLTLGFENPISFLPPEKSIRQLYGYGHSVLKKDEHNSLSANVQYSSLENVLHKDSFRFDLSYLWGITFPEELINKSLQDISCTLSSVAHRMNPYRGIMGPPPVESSLQSIAKSLELITSALDTNKDDGEGGSNE